MRASRAYIAGLGTTSVLVCSALVMLMLGSAFLAFTGWPGIGALEDFGSVVLGEPPDDSSEAGPARRGDRAAARKVDRARRGSRPSRAVAGLGAPTASPRSDAPRAPTGQPQPPSPGRPDIRGAPAPAPPNRTGLGTPTSSTPVRAPAGTPASRSLTGDLADTTGGMTDGLGSTVGGLSPEFGRGVTNTGRTLSGLLRGLGGSR